jgi:hypothetical protein
VKAKPGCDFDLAAPFHSVATPKQLTLTVRPTIYINAFLLLHYLTYSLIKEISIGIEELEQGERPEHEFR